MMIYFGGHTDPSSSFSCSSNCTSLYIFHWAGQSWSSQQDAVAYGLRLDGKVAAAIRALSLAHVALAALIFYSWLTVPGKVLFLALKSNLTRVSRQDVPESKYRSNVTLYKLGSTQRWTQIKLFLSFIFTRVRACCAGVACCGAGKPTRAVSWLLFALFCRPSLCKRCTW